MTRTGEAGRRGTKIRSDCWIGVELRDVGGITTTLQSKVETMYGERIRAQIADGCAQLGVAHVAVTIEDHGALPFVIAARLETAVKRADASITTEYLLPVATSCTYGTTRERLRRSRLYLPGNEPKFFINAGLHGPDGLILDLEDSVAPSEKDAARAVVRNALRAVDCLGAERMVRINQGERGIEDLDWIIPHNVHVVLIPKVEHPRYVDRV